MAEGQSTLLFQLPQSAKQLRLALLYLEIRYVSFSIQGLQKVLMKLPIFCYFMGFGFKTNTKT